MKDDYQVADEEEVQEEEQGVPHLRRRWIRAERSDASSSSQLAARRRAYARCVGC